MGRTEDDARNAAAVANRSGGQEKDGGAVELPGHGKERPSLAER